MHVTLDHVQTITPTIRTFWLKPERKVRYVAGQFTELHLPHEKPDERGIRRWFTLSSSPSEELLAITTRIEPERGSSFKQQLSALKPGAKLHLADPMGDFVLPKDPTIPIVFVAVGLGITPVRSMVKWLLDTNQKRHIQLIYAVSQPEELAFKPLIKSFDLAVTTIFTKQNGRLTSDHILSLVNVEPLIYLSGPEIMVETFYKELRSKGIPSSHLVADYFPGYSQQ